MSETASRSDLAQRWLRGYCERGPGVRSAVVLLGEALEEAAHWPAAGTAHAPLLAAARAAVKRGRALALTPPVGEGAGAEPGRILSLPLASGEGAFGALAVALQAGPADTDEALLRDLERAAATLAGALQGGAGAPRRPAAGSALLRLQGLLLKPQPLAQAASALASELAASLGFERVSLGLSARSGLTVLALSHGAEFGPRQRLIQALAGAMQEAIDQGASLVYPPPPEAAPRIVQAHGALAAQGPGTLLTVPLIDAGAPIGALCFERAGALRAEELRTIEQLACVLAPLIELKRRAEQPWPARAAESLHGCLAGRTRRLGALAGLAGALLLAWVPVSYRIGAPARLEGAVQRVLAAPAEGYLHAAHVRPGDAVEAGQLLVELAQQDLLLQARKWEAELTQHENSAAAALARAERTQYALAQARAAEAAAQLELARGQLARTQLTAPIDGLVIKGDLSQSLGAPVQRGEVLLTLAPREAFRLIVEVDERDIGALAPGQRGQLALSALPGERLAFTVKRISPVALTTEGRNAFEVEAAFDAPPAGLRPGLQGVAKIEAGAQPLGWIATHRIGDWLRFKLWGWTG